ncbi:hypothetical protein LOZ65_003968 [Ophidiomyces ophidiicola]|nr:hypothetical protein LOZ65_003968 [Ophidiomyces ophidiicola]
MEERAGQAGTTIQPPEPAVIASSSSLRSRSRVSALDQQPQQQQEEEEEEQDQEPPQLPPHDGGVHELFELHEIPTHTRRDSSPSTISSGEFRVVSRRSTRESQMTRSSREPTGRFRHLIKFWRRNVVLSVAQDQKRDHFALERTYLAHMRTSLVFSLMGVLIAQLFSLQHTEPGRPAAFGFRAVGVPLACVCQGCAIVVTLGAAARFLRQQGALSRGKIHAAGWEVMMVATLTAAALITLLVLVVMISVQRDST